MKWGTIGLAAGSAAAGFLLGALLTGGGEHAGKVAPVPAVPEGGRVEREGGPSMDEAPGVDVEKEAAAPTDKKTSQAPEGIDPELWAAMDEIMEELKSYRDQMVGSEMRKNRRQMEEMTLRLGLNEHQQEWMLELMDKNSLQPYGELLGMLDRALADPEATKREMAQRFMDVKAQRETEGKSTSLGLSRVLDPEWSALYSQIRKGMEPWDRKGGLLGDMKRVLSPPQQEDLAAYCADLAVVREETDAARAQSSAVYRLRRVTLDVPLSNEQRDQLMGLFLKNPQAGEQDMAKVLTPQQMEQWQTAAQLHSQKKKKPKKNDGR